MADLRFRWCISYAASASGRSRMFFAALSRFFSALKHSKQSGWSSAAATSRHPGRTKTARCPHAQRCRFDLRSLLAFNDIAFPPHMIERPRQGHGASFLRRGCVRWRHGEDCEQGTISSNTLEGEIGVVKTPFAFAAIGRPRPVGLPRSPGAGLPARKKNSNGGRLRRARRRVGGG